MSEEGYIDVCILKRCGKLYGNKECCKQIAESGLRSIVLESIWETIEKEKCAQYINGVCISREICRRLQTFCYPIPLRKKKINRLVVVMFVYYCADVVADDSTAEATYDAVYSAANAYVAAYAEAAYAITEAAAYDAREVGDAARDEFYREASEELVRLIDAWGTPIKEE